ncbi:M16 family metallopeptidase [Wolbachia endosymbiont of Howardula sp.]|uniref:M16 family metallopeptidase n=1 Tax=Wolbachia endosymbiont of Howardula sp. TaxID=2916816 RepID=UPI00217CC65F|nr:pitrilysin family protein [Wolbachia endosymbiont of Howardula sp.]UWI83243.1 insulinase family protein [Wolbachia endosymbiont of Howardula sp.]
MIEPTITTLDNGIRIVTDYMPHVNSVAFNIHLGVGSRDESISQYGISHFLEHMAFKGTKTKTALEIAQAFDNIGGVFNASTDRESTMYYAKVLKQDIMIAIDILIDILMNSTFPPDELEREKSVIIQEIFQTNDSINDIIFDKYFEVAYPNQAFGKPILGTQDSIKSFTRTDLTDYMDQHYYGKNIIFAAAGNITHEELVILTEKLLSQISYQRINKRSHTRYIGGEYMEHRVLDQIYLMMGFPGVSRYDNQYYALQVLDCVLGNGMSSRLFQSIRERQGLAYSIYSFHASYADTGIFSIFASTDHSHVNQLLESIILELKIISSNLKEEEIKRAKARMISQILMSRESVSSRATSLSYYYSQYNTYITKQELINKISMINVHEVKQSAEKLLLQAKHITLAAIGDIKALPNYNRIISMIS